MKSNLFLCLLIVFGIISYDLNSQLFFSNTEIELKKETYLESMQLDFEKWKIGKNLRKEKGWKQFKRWEWFNESRSFADRTTPNDKYYIEAHQQINKIKESKSKVQDNNSWIPVGPLNFPLSYDLTSGHGMGRVNCITFHPTNPNTFWVGTPRGGIWKTNNNGISWIPLGDNLPMPRISDIAVDPKNPDVLYLAMGDYAYIALDVTNRVRYNGFGLGIYKTTNGGDSWFQTNLSRHPKNKELSLMMGVLVNKEETNKVIAAGSTGIFITSDGGENWTNTLDGLVWDIKQDPSDNNTVYITTGYLPQINNNSNARIYKSTDFGEHWIALNSGIPERGNAARVELAIYEQDPNYIYAIATTTNSAFHSVYRSTNSGNNWTKQSDYNNAPNILDWAVGDMKNMGQGLYDLTLAVSPDNPDEIYVGGINHWGSTDGGKTFNLITYWVNNMGLSVHADHHCAKFNPHNKQYYICHDGGVSRTNKIIIGDNSKIKEFFYDTTGTKSYQFPTEWIDISSGLVITEFYRLGLCKEHSNYIIGGAQDNSTNYYKKNYWINWIDGDGMEAMIAHNNPETIYGTVYFGMLIKSTDGCRTYFKGGADLCDTIKNTESGNWVTPFIMHPDNPQMIYAGFGNLWKTTNGGDSWIKLSNFPKMTSNTYPLPIFSMAICSTKTDNIVIYKRLFPAYDQIGQLWKTTDEGKNWVNISAGLPLDSLYVNSIAIHSENPNIILLAMSGFEDGKKVYATNDGGVTWYNYSLNMVNIPINSIVHQQNSSIFYIGTDIGVFYTSDENPGWNPYDTDLPNTIVTDLKIHYKSNRLYASTFGRGIWENQLIRPTSNIELENSPHFEIFPTPAQNELNIHIPDATGNYSVELIDIKGNTVYNTTKYLNDEDALQINFDLNDGIYFLRMVNIDNFENELNQVYTKKVLIRK